MTKKTILPVLRRRAGQMAITMVITSLLLLLIMIPLLDRYIQNEAKWAVKERKSTMAFHLAEAGLDRAYWKLKESAANWTTITTGGHIDTYNNDHTFEDGNFGSYRIKMEQGETNLQVKITATGKDKSNNEYRSIQAIYAKEGVTAALQAGTVSGSGNVNVHWGPMMSLTSMALSGASNELFPRKYARGAITAAGGYATRDNDANAPNKGPHTSGDHIEWWSYNESPGVPDVLTPDTSYYMDLAKGQTCSPAGTEGCYYEGNRTINGLVDATCEDGADPKVRYFTNNLTLSGNKYFCGVLIVMGDLTVTGGADNAGKITVNPPTTAWKEYQCNVPTHSGDSDAGAMTAWTYEPDGVHPGGCDGPHGDTTAVDEYPGDAGYHTVGEYNFYTGRTLSGHCGLGNNASTGRGAVAFKGYIYVAGNFSNAGGNRFFGSVCVAGPGGLTGGGDIFYDSGMSVRFLNNNISRSSWYEVKPVAF